MDVATRPARTGPLITLWLLRLAVTAHLVAVLAQPILAGRYLTGDVDAITAHGAVGTALAALDLLVIAAAAVYVVGGRGALWVLPAAVLLFLAVGLQIGMGFARQLGVHVPARGRDRHGVGDAHCVGVDVVGASGAACPAAAGGHVVGAGRWGWAGARSPRPDQAGSHRAVSARPGEAPSARPESSR